jgi:hypothetical protein
MMFFVRQGIKGANIWDVYSDSYLPLLKWIGGELRKSPTYYALSLFSNDFGGNIVEMNYTGPSMFAPNIYDTSQKVEIPSLSAITTMDATSKNLYVIVINNESRSITAKFNIPSFNASDTMTVWTLSGPDPYATNDGSAEVVTVSEEQRQTTDQMSFPPFSMTKIAVKESEAEPPPSDDLIVFADSFETGLGNWGQDAQNDWFRSSQRARDGNYSAEIDGRATDAQLISHPIDLKGRTNATITFTWYIESGLDTENILPLMCRLTKAHGSRKRVFVGM